MNSKKNRKTPCKECPFRRDNTLDKSYPGGSSPFVYIGQSEGPFWLPCHMDKEYNDKETDPKAVSQCAGAAIYRANLKISERLPKELLNLPENKEIVFASHAEFLSYYDGNISVEKAEDFIRDFKIVNICLQKELSDANVKRLDL